VIVMPEITIRDVGPIEAVTIPVPEHGGVVVLRGANGTGKSTALDAIDTMARGNGALSARARHGAKKGSIEGLGASVTVGLTKSSRKGELEVATFEARVNVAALVDPGIKDPAIADRYRIATACGLAGIEPDPEQFRAIATDVELDESVFEGDDIVLIAGRVRNAIHAAARSWEAKGIDLAARSRALFEAAGEPGDTVPVEQAQQALEAAIAEQSALKAAAASAAQAAEAASVARRGIAALEAQPFDGGSVERLRGEVGEAEAALPGLQQEVEDLRARLAEAEQNVRDCSSYLDAKRRELAGAERHDADLAKAMDLLEEAMAGSAAPSPEAIADADYRVNVARQALAKAATAERAARQREEADRVHAEALAAADRATALRDASQQTDAVLAAHLAAVMPQGLRVQDGRLVVDRGKRVVPFGELSDGERWHIALDLAIEAMGGTGLVAIQQVAWEGLDGPSRRSIAEHAEARGVLIVTAEADHGEVAGPLRAEVFGS
jgi:DNA repair ATPase RecN